jgi:hypothetical protein
MRKARKWPREQSMSMQELEGRGAPLGLLFENQESRPEATRRLIRNYLAEIRRRAELMLGFLGLDWPKTDAQWLNFVMKLCQHWDIPAFQVTQAPSRGPGAGKKWTDQKNCELFADVNELVRRRKFSARSAGSH